MGNVKILSETIKNPITFIGKNVGVAYGSNTKDDDKNYKRGKQCIKDGHGRVLEFAIVHFTLEGYSCRVIREFARHIAGSPTFIQESTRYVDFSKGFEFVIPPKIKDNKDSHLLKVYIKAIHEAQDAIEELIRNDIPVEDAQMLMPLAATTKLSCQYNMRTLATMSNQRMCSLAYWEFRDLMNDLKKALSEYSPEWKTLVDLLFKPKCEITGYCVEKRCCGRKPYKSVDEANSNEN